jgi:hypothetical protein
VNIDGRHDTARESFAKRADRVSSIVDRFLEQNMGSRDTVHRALSDGLGIESRPLSSRDSCLVVQGEIEQRAANAPDECAIHKIFRQARPQRPVARHIAERVLRSRVARDIERLVERDGIIVDDLALMHVVREPVDQPAV